MSSFVQDSTAVLDYVVNWVNWLPVNTMNGQPDAISASAFTVDTGMTISGTPTHDGTTATVFLTGGVDGKEYMVTNHITTTGGRQDSLTFTVSVESGAHGEVDRIIMAA